MSFEVELRERLQREAAAVPLPGRDPRIAANRAKTIRHRRQLTAAGMVVLSAAVILGAPLLLANQGSDGDGASTFSGPGYGLPETGLIELDWQTSAEGLSFPTMSIEDDDGVIYALSTAPGRIGPGRDMAPRALYRLGEDGTWEPVLVDDERSQVADLVSGDDGLLYAIGTAPAADGEGTVASLATSGDGGATWTTNYEVDPVAPPSDVVEWDQFVDVGIETNGSATIAAVTTTFFPELEPLFPELQDPDAGNLSIELRPEGASLIRYEMPEGLDAGVLRSGEDPNADGAAIASTPTTIVAPPEGTEVRRLTWEELGVEGQHSLSTTKLFTRAGDGWQDVTSPEFAHAGATTLSVAAGRFVAIGYGPVSAWDSTQNVLTSEDGTAWSPIETPVEGDVVGFGDALVNVAWFDGAPQEGDPVLSVSTDAGATWTEVDLAEAGLEPGTVVYSASGGPLGLALLVGPARTEVLGGAQLLFTGDLVDWTVIDLTEITGMPVRESTNVFVGENQVVVTSSTMTAPADSATAVGTPVR